MSDIRINSLPSEPNPSATDNLAIDGATTRRATAQAVVNAGAPVASQAEAQAGTDAVKRMTPLTTKQSIAANAATFAQGALADSSLQPATGQYRVATFAAAPTATIPAAVNRVFIGDRRANFVPVASAPSHNLKFQNGSQWWEIDEPDVSSKMAGAAIDGANDDLGALTDLFGYCTITGRPITVRTGAYNLSANLTPDFSSAKVTIEDGVTFPGSGILSLEKFLPWQVIPVFSNDSETKDYSNAEISQYNNQYLLARNARVSTAGSAAVALFGQGEAAGSGARAWGANVLGQVTGNGGTAIGVEVDCGIRGSATTGNAYGVVVGAAGNAQPRAAFQAQVHSAATKFVDGMIFAFNSVSGSGCVSGSLWKAIGVSLSAGSCQRFLHVDANISATVAEIDIPSLIVAATPATVANRLQISGAASGNGPDLAASGSDTDISLSATTKGTGVFIVRTSGSEAFRVASGGGTDNIQISAGTGSCIINVRGSSTNVALNIQGKGTGAVNIRSSAGVAKVTVDATGIGFFAHATAGQATMAAATGTSQRTTFDTSSVTLPQLAGVVKALIDDFRGWGLHA